MSGLDFLRLSLEHCHKDKLAEITERHQIEYSKEKRALKDKFEHDYLSLHSKLQDKRPRTNFVWSRLVENWPQNPLTKERKR